eukprot:scaffold66766_cov19-Tisochrysis_lutea.AAC.1
MNLPGANGEALGCWHSMPCCVGKQSEAFDCAFFCNLVEWLEYLRCWICVLYFVGKQAEVRVS